METARQQCAQEPNLREPVINLVIQDLKARAELGVWREGTSPQSLNGSSSLVEVYQGLLDTALYMKQFLEGVRERHEEL